MFNSKVAIFLCASLALSMAAPTDLLGGLDLGNILKPVTGLVGNLIDNLSKLIQGLTGTIADLVNQLVAALQQLTKVLNIPAGTDPLSFVQNLVKQLDPIVKQLLGTVSSGVEGAVGNVENTVNGVTGDLSQVLGQVAKILNLPVEGLVGALQDLVKSLGSVLVQILELVQKLLKELLTDLTKNIDLVSQLSFVNQLVGVVTQLLAQLETILNAATKAGAQ
ncbi:hypothetical protein M3Y97_00626000 [Aphelenchoides bicaudatus]|nr:hypothetical protein M3Y97_00626000 [Aphelenchoides bicaudatus]